MEKTVELSWSTFLLEIVNFLVLLWILKRFFYRPVQAVIERRRTAIEERLARAERKEQEGLELQRQYESRLEQWRGERQKAREVLEEELQTERLQREEALRDELEQQRQKSAAVEARHRRELQRQQELQAMEQGSEFAARLLQRGSGPELELRLVDLLLDGLESLDDGQVARLREQLVETDTAPEVASAFPLDADQREKIGELLGEIVQREPHCHFVEDPELLAGLRIAIGPWELGANLRDELRGFARLAQESAGE